MAWLQAKNIARAIFSGFERHYRLFRGITADARQRFEDADWPAVQATARERISYYDLRVAETIVELRERFAVAELDEPLWRRVKVEYLRLLPLHRQPELAETYYNSVFCHLFHRSYYNNGNIFVWPAVSTEHLEAEVPIFRCWYPGRDGFCRVICSIVDSFDFALPFRQRRSGLCDIFPGDFLFKNFGVTRQGRVVFYDYDEICYLTECNFRAIPEAPYPEMEMSEETWYTAAPNDVFPEEFATFLLTDPEIRKHFRARHGDLLEPVWWREQQANIIAGRLEDVFPYGEERRFRRREALDDCATGESAAEPMTVAG